MKQEKVGLTAMNWISSIVGIILLSSFIILPPIFRVAFKETDTKKPEEVITYPTLTTTCYKDNIQTDTSTDVETYIFQHQNNKIKRYTKSTIKSYIDPNNYELDKQNFGRLVTAYSVLNGYNYTVTPNDEQLSLNIQANYDLEIFKSTMITIPGDSEPTEVSSAYLIDSLVNDIEAELTTNGYLCSQND